MSDHGAGRAAKRFAVAVLAGTLVVSLSACGTPSNLDHQEQVAFARECVSLIERDLSDNTPPRAATVGGEQVNLDDPSDFYSRLLRLRGPATYNLHDPKHSSDVGRQPLDNCNTQRLLSSLFTPPSTTTTTTTTSTTVPGS